MSKEKTPITNAAAQVDTITAILFTVLCGFAVFDAAIILSTASASKIGRASCRERV